MDPFLDEPQSSGPGFDPMAMVRAFLRRKWLFIIPFILCFSMAAVAIKIMTPIYYSAGQVRIIMENAKTNLIDNPANRYGRTRNVDRMAREEMDMLLTSPDFLEKMVRDLSLHLLVQENQALAGKRIFSDEKAVKVAMARLKMMLRVEQDGSHLFLIGIRDIDPDQAFRMISHILEAFLVEYRANQMAFRTSTRDFLEEQLLAYRVTLVNAEKELTGFQSSQASTTLIDNPVNSRNLGHAEINLGRMKDRQRGSDRTEMARLKQDVLAVMDPLPPLNRFRTDPAINTVLNQMVNLALARNVYSQASQGFLDFEDNLARMRLRLNTLIEIQVSSEYPRLPRMDRNRIGQYVYFSLFQDGLKRVADRLTVWINDFRTFTAKQPELSVRLAELQDEVTQASGLVQTLEREIIQQNLNLEASQSEIGFQIKIRQKPWRPDNPIEPNKMKLLLMGFMLSLAIGTGLVVLSIMLDRSYHTVEDIEHHLGLKVIGVLPVIQDDIFERKRKLRILRWVTIVLGILAIGAVGFLVIYPRLS